jgi:protein O-mannosyl-transferase
MTDDRRRRTAWAALALVVLGVAAYANSFSGVWLLDDRAALLENDAIRSLSPLGRVLFGQTSATLRGRPFLNLTFALDHAMFGTTVAGRHAVNLAIHVAAGLALFGVVRRTLASPRVPASVRDAATGLAFAVASVWTVHPLQTESVTYLCQRAESLAGFFYLATLYCAIRGDASSRSRSWHAAAITACLLGVATKETVATAPLVVLLHDRAFLAGSFRDAWRARRGLYLGLAATWLPLAALMISSGDRGDSAGFGHGVSVAEYAATQPGAIVTYLRLAVWPHPLVLDRGAGVATTFAEVGPHAAAVAALLAATIWALVRRPMLGFLGATFFVVLAPTSSFVPLVTQTVAEHRMYLPLAAVVTAAVLGAQRVVPRRTAAACALATTLVVLVAVTLDRNATYGSAVAMWRGVVAHDPANVRAQMNLGLALTEAGEVADAMQVLDRAVALDPGNAYAHLLRGNVRHEAGLRDGAVADYTAAASSPRRAPRALTSRAVVRLESGDVDEALADLDAALALDPDFAPAYAARAAVRLARGEHDLAWTDVAAARRLGRPPSDAWLDRLRRASGRAE